MRCRKLDVAFTPYLYSRRRSHIFLVKPRNLFMQKLKHLITGSCLLALIWSGCAVHNTSSVAGGKRPIVKVALYANGRLMVDGQPSNVKALRSSLEPIVKQHGSVWYFRETSVTGGPPENAMEVMRTLIDTGLPIRYSSHPDFSDSTDEDGRAIATEPWMICGLTRLLQ
jgi:hypothetical protein